MRPMPAQEAQVCPIPSLTSSQDGPQVLELAAAGACAACAYIPRRATGSSKVKGGNRAQFPDMQPISGCEGARLPPRGTQYFTQALEPAGGAGRKGPDGRPEPERKEPSREGDFPDAAGSWSEKGGQLTHPGQGQRTVLLCWEQLLGAGVWAAWPPNRQWVWGVTQAAG